MLYRLQWICDNFASKAYKFTYMYVTCTYSGNTKHFEYYWRQKYIYLSGIFSFKNYQNLLWYVKGNIHVYLKKQKTFVCTRYVHVILDLSPFGIFNKK